MRGLLCSPNKIYLMLLGVFFLILGTEILYFKVNGVQYDNSTVNHVKSNSDHFYLDCFYDVIIQEPSLYKIDSLGAKTRLNYFPSKNGFNKFIRYDILSSERSYKHAYYCSDYTQRYHIQITLDYGKVYLKVRHNYLFKKCV